MVKLLTNFAKCSILNLWVGSEYVSSFKLSAFCIFQDCQYVTVLNFQGYTGFTYFRKYERVLNIRRDAIMEAFYSRIPNIPGYCICKRRARFWICLNMAKWCLNKFCRLLNMPPVLNMPRPRVWQDCEYASYIWCWIYLNKPEYALIMLNMLEYASIYLKKRSSGCATILNVSNAVLGIY